MREDEFAVIFSIMVDYFNAKPSEAVSNVYYEAFKSWFFEDFKKACQMTMESRIYSGLPKIAEIKEALVGNIEDAKVMAFESLMQATQIGTFTTIIFEDGAIAHAIESMGGWERVCEMTWDDWKFRKKEFESLYTSYLRRGETDPIRMIGAFEANNSQNKDWEKFTPKPITVKSKNKFLIDKLHQGAKFIEQFKEE